MADNDYDVEIPQYVPGQKAATLAYQNNNPGNIRYVGQSDAVPGVGGFAKFKDPSTGYHALRNHVEKHQDKTLEQYIHDYAPPTDGNNTAAYIKSAQDALGVAPGTKLSAVDRDALAQFQAHQESRTKVAPADPETMIRRIESQHQSTATPGEDPEALIKQVEDQHKATTATAPVPTKAPQGSWNSQHDTLENIAEQAEDIGGQLGRNIGGLGQAVYHKGKDVLHAILHPVDTYNTLANTPMDKPEDQLPKLSELPVIGPLSEGRYGAAVGDVATGALLGKAGELVEGAPPFARTKGAATADAVLKASDPKEILNQQLLQKVQASKPIPPELDTPVSEESYQASAKPLTEALQPQNGMEFKDVQARRLIPLLKAEEPLIGNLDNPKTVVPRMRQALDIAKLRNRTEFQPYVDAAEARGAKFETDSTAQAMKSSISDQFKREHAQEAADLSAWVDSVYKGKTMSPSEFQDGIETNNAKLKAYFKAKGDVQNAQALTQVEKAMTLAQQDAYHDTLYKGLDPKLGGASLRELQARYGSLAEGSKSLATLEDKLAKASTSVGPLQKTRAGLEGIGKVIDLQHPLSGLAKIIPEETTQGKLARAFKSYPKQSTLKEVPKPLPWELSSPGSAEFGRQRGLDEQTLPSTALTNAKNQHSDIPIEQLRLKKTGPGIFSWQRQLFPETPERPVEPRP